MDLDLLFWFLALFVDRDIVSGSDLKSMGLWLYIRVCLDEIRLSELPGVWHRGLSRK